MFKKTLMVLVALTMLLSFSTRAEAQLCVPALEYDELAWTWEYYGPCSSTYNCLSYALGITNSWTWPWGYSHPTDSQVTTYMSSKGYNTTGSIARIASYGTTSGVVHFSKIASSSICYAKCGQLNLLKHRSLDPYRPSGDYGPLVRIYKYTPNNLAVNISGPSYGNEGVNYTWCANVSGGTGPYTYHWKYSNNPNLFINTWSTTQCKTAQLPHHWKDVYFEVTVTDATGFQKKAYFHSVNNQGVPNPHRISSTNSQQLQNKLNKLIAELEFHFTGSTSPNPYNYINNDAYRKIVALGPEALDTIKHTILFSRENGLTEYILAIAAEEIAHVNLKKQSSLWVNSKEWAESWTLFLRELPDKVDSIIGNSSSEEQMNKRIEALGLAALPLLEDRIKDGNTLLKTAHKVLKHKSEVSKTGPEQYKHSDKNITDIFRKLIKKSRHQL